MRSAHVIPLSFMLLTLGASGCLIQDLEKPAELKECQSLRDELASGCLCDPLTYELVCPDDLGPPIGGEGGTGGEAGEGGTGGEGGMGGEGGTGGTGGVEPLCPEELPADCSCDLQTGAIECEMRPFMCSDWLSGAFSYPLDDSACPAGTPFTRYDAIQDLWVGLIRCGGGSMSRVYLSFDNVDYYPAADLTGSGEDHCELIEPGWAPLSNDQDITSGGCSGCSVTSTLSVEGPSFYRATEGELFGFAPNGMGLSSRLVCGTSCL